MNDENQNSKRKNTSDNGSSDGTTRPSSQRKPTPPNTDLPSWDGSPPGESELPVEGRIVSWLMRKKDGAVIFGNLYPPGTFSLVACPDDESDPDVLIGEKIVGRQAGWFHTPTGMGFSHSIPSTAGTYLMVKPNKE